MKQQRLRILAAVLAGGLVVLAAGCAPGGAKSSSGGRSGTIKVGMLRPATGPLAANGRDMENGWALYWDQHGDKAGQVKVQTIVEDTAGNPSVALNKANQLVSSQGVDMIVGPLAANEGLALAAPLNQKQVVTVMPIVSADDLTQRKRYPYVVRLAGWTSSQTAHPFGQWAYEQGYRNVLTIGYDFAFGYEGVGGFVNTFTDKGGKIVKQLWAPLNTQDYSSYVTQIRQASPDAVFAFLSGADAVRFFKAYQDFGLLHKVPLLGGETMTDQSILQNLGSAALGIMSSGHFAEGSDNPDTRKFVDDYFAKYGKYPSYYSADMYTAASGIAAALQSVNGDLSDKQRFIQDLKGLTLEHNPIGPEKLDQYGNPVFNVYVRKVGQGPHGPWNVPVKTYQQVSQFWTYDPAEFLRHPVYSKSYQGNGVWPDPQS